MCKRNKTSKASNVFSIIRSTFSVNITKVTLLLLGNYEESSNKSSNESQNTVVPLVDIKPPKTLF